MTALQSSVYGLKLAAQAADRIKAEDILAFDVSMAMGITDAMFIASASSERQVLAVAEEIEKDLATKGERLKPLGREGLDDARWVLLDYGDFVINVMHEDDRRYYELERLWKDCPSIDLQLLPHVADDMAEEH